MHAGTLVPETLYKIEEDEESSNLCDDNTNSSDSEDSSDDSKSSDSDDYSSKDSSGYVEESFEVMFVPEEELQQVIAGMRESME